MKNFETVDFDFEEGVDSDRTRNFRNGDTVHTITGKQHSKILGVEEIFTPEREARIVAHQKRIQAGLKARGLLRKKVR